MTGWFVAFWIYAMGTITFGALVIEEQPQWWRWYPLLVIVLWPIAMSMYVLRIPLPRIKSQ